MLHEGTTLLLALCLGTAISGVRWLKLKRLVRADQLSTSDAQTKFNAFSIVHLVLSGTIYFWALLWILPASILKLQSGHNFVGVPLAGLLAGAVGGIVVSATGRYYLQNRTPNAN